MNLLKLKKLEDLLTAVYTMALFSILPLIFILDVNPIAILYILVPAVSLILVTKVALSMAQLRAKERIVKGIESLEQDPKKLVHSIAA